jgi:hypothetical protein
MAALIYLLCALTALCCFFLLFRSWLANRVALLFWSSLCFAGLSINNILLVIDKLVVPDIDLGLFRLVAALVSVLLLLFGLIWEDQ